MFKFLKKINNASVMPKVYYGLHMVEGVAEYRPPDKEPYRILLGQKATKQMDTTFPGAPVIVGHALENVTPENVEEIADGYVVDSFYNKADGNHWAKFIVITDRGHEAIRNGFKLSNSYFITKNGAGGKWHGVDYAQEVIEGKYEHLAIVNDPRYSESVIMSPEQFKLYNEQKEGELLQLANSNEPEPKDKKTEKKEKSTMFNFLKREKVENSDELANMSVVLPKSKVEKSLKLIINEADKAESEKGKDKMANESDKIMCNGEEMSVGDLVKKHENMCKKKNEEDDEKKKNENDDKIAEMVGSLTSPQKEMYENMSDEDKDKLQNMSDDEREKHLKNMEKEEEKKKENKKNNSNFDRINNANNTGTLNDVPVFETSIEKVARGKARYGSN